MRKEIGISVPYRKTPAQDSLEKQLAVLRQQVALLEGRVKQLEKNK
jgi:hypothetical protein